jgi:hypothetical protein
MNLGRHDWLWFTSLVLKLFEYLLSLSLGNHTQVFHLVLQAVKSDVLSTCLHGTCQRLGQALHRTLEMILKSKFVLLALWNFVLLQIFLIFLLVPHSVVDLLYSFLSLVSSIYGFCIVVRDSSDLGGSCDGAAFLVDEPNEL